MSPNSLRYRRGKRKPLRPALPLATEVDQHYVDTLGNKRTITPRPSTLNDIDDELASVITPGRIHPHYRGSRKHGPSPKIIRRQADQFPSTNSVLPSIGFSESMTTTMTTTTTTTTLIPSSTASSIPMASSTTFPSTATPTATLKPKGQDPMSSVAVQAILGGLAVICILGVVLRCLHVSRQYRAVIEARQQNLARVQMQPGGGHSSPHGGAGETNLAPTSEMTLAARLNMYQTRDGVRRHYYPYGQEPYGRRDGRAFGSVDSFVAPSYEHDVSPPPFVAASGKPPAYVETGTIIVTPPSETHPDTR